LYGVLYVPHELYLYRQTVWWPSRIEENAGDWSNAQVLMWLDKIVLSGGKSLVCAGKWGLSISADQTTRGFPRLRACDNELLSSQRVTYFDWSNPFWLTGHQSMIMYAICQRQNRLEKQKRRREKSKRYADYWLGNVCSSNFNQGRLFSSPSYRSWVVSPGKSWMAGAADMNI
jgi:hypothetical protein